MFYGEFEHCIDAKGRVIIPAKFREGLGERFYIAKEQDHCIGVYTLDHWNTIMEKISQLPDTNDAARAYKRFKLAGASECAPDGNGRIMIPQPLRDYAGITKEIISIGNGRNVEIWDKEKWQEYQSALNESGKGFSGLESYGI